jgi:formyltetrahydrofolate-dependent phosphoribosylglycinamide formyltransferase
MFERLQKKWKVNGIQLTLILFTFAIGGSLTGYAGRKLMGLVAIDQKWLWIIIYIIIITLLWPAAVLLISLFTGQFPFFIKYIKKIGARMGIGHSRQPAVHSRQPTVGSKQSATGSQEILHTTRIAIFASGTGSNTQKIIDHFRNKDLTQTLSKGEGFKNPKVVVSLIVCNNPAAGVLKIAEKENIPSLIIEKEKFFRGNGYTDELKEKKIDLVVLAGFLWKLPSVLVNAYPRRIINIHPALLPKYGGKGMYGNSVHAAVIAAGEKESGITIHYADEQYDNGDIILQVKCPLLPGDTPGSLAERIHKLEHEHYPKVIEEVASMSNK